MNTIEFFTEHFDHFSLKNFSFPPGGCNNKSVSIIIMIYDMYTSVLKHIDKILENRAMRKVTKIILITIYL